ncbi:MAG: hypothetical protein COU51_00345 [Parcubacteria group bacterium CG10_big_fil_rev_8_21_14_0_10_36_14]|nr:MAG: hypothetical protein COU51_00345 [Parcubacteria group bacterium CG10_big_fil_rev_8_21_14_0_10_36_14]
MQLVLIFAVAVAMNAVATILLKIGSAKFTGGFSLQIIVDILKNYHVWGGILLYIASFPPYVYIFSRMNVSIAYPIFTSLSFATTIMIAAIFLKESLTIPQFFGLILVVGGIVLLATNGQT